MMTKPPFTHLTVEQDELEYLSTILDAFYSRKDVVEKDFTGFPAICKSLSMDLVRRKYKSEPGGMISVPITPREAAILMVFCIEILEEIPVADILTGGRIGSLHKALSIQLDTLKTTL